MLCSAPLVLFRKGSDALTATPQWFGPLPELLAFGRDQPDQPNTPLGRVSKSPTRQGSGGGHASGGPTAAGELHGDGSWPLDLVASPGAPRLLNVAALREAHTRFADFVFRAATASADPTLAVLRFRRLAAAAAATNRTTGRESRGQTAANSYAAQQANASVMATRAETAARAWAAGGAPSEDAALKDGRGEAVAPVGPSPWHGLEGAYSAYFQVHPQTSQTIKPQYHAICCKKAV